MAAPFTTVNGAAQKYLSLVDTGTSATVGTFVVPVFNYGGIRDMVKVGNRLIVGGFFTTANNLLRQGLASVNATTGTLDSYMNVQLTGHHNDTGDGAQGFTGPWALDASPDGKHLAVTGNFKNADGLLRDQLVMIDLTPPERGGRRLGDQPLLAVLLQLGVRRLHPWSQLLPGRLVLRRQRHRWWRSGHVV